MTTKIGIIGCGYWGPKLARNFHEIPTAHLEWVADLDPERLAHMQELYPYVKTTQDYGELLRSDVEAIAIATPISTHCAIAMDCLQAGKHVLIEKPLAASVADAELIARTGDEKKLVVMVGHTFQYNPAVRAVRQIVNSGELGEIYYINCTRVNLGLLQPDINVVWDLAPHDISILLDVLGQEPQSVSARGGVYVQREKGLHDVAYLTLNFPSGILADLRVSWLDPVKIRRITIVGSKKMLVYNDIVEPKVTLYDKGVDRYPYSDTFEEFTLSYRHGAETPYPVEWVEPLRVECEHFLSCIEAGQRPRSDGWFGVKVIKILEAAQKSLLNGGAKEAVEK